MHHIPKGSRRFMECQTQYKSAKKYQLRGIKSKFLLESQGVSDCGKLKELLICSCGIDVLSEYYRKTQHGVQARTIGWYFFTRP